MVPKMIIPDFPTRRADRLAAGRRQNTITERLISSCFFEDCFREEVK
jgi:hypothetical protein